MVTAVSIHGTTARLIVSTPFDGITETASAGAVFEGGEWKISEPPGHVKAGHDLVYRVPSGSMEPTLSIGATILVDPTAYATRSPALGDIIVFYPPAGADAAAGACGSARQGVGHPQACSEPTGARSNQIFIKRIAAVPGDRISITN
jgi:Signal peptidase, peptidase S26